MHKERTLGFLEEKQHVGNNDPNRAEDPEYILRLIGQVIAVSLETVEIVKGLPALESSL